MAGLKQAALTGVSFFGCWSVSANQPVFATVILQLKGSCFLSINADQHLGGPLFVVLWRTADISELDLKCTSRVMCMQHRTPPDNSSESSACIWVHPLCPALSIHIYHTLNICSLPENTAQLLVGVARRTLSFVGISKPAESVEGSGFLWKCTQELPLLKAQANLFFCALRSLKYCCVGTLYNLSFSTLPAFSLLLHQEQLTLAEESAWITPWP